MIKRLLCLLLGHRPVPWGGYGALLAFGAVDKSTLGFLEVNPCRRCGCLVAQPVPKP